MSRISRLPFVAASALACCWPVLGHACAVCGEGSGRNHAAFFNSTIFLSLLPLALLAGGVFWLARNAREFLASEFSESDEPPVSDSASQESPTVAESLGPLSAADGASS